MEDPVVQQKVAQGLDTFDSFESRLPKLPRFTTFMTPPAQFCVMKGYEDILHEKLAEKFPDKKNLLRRSRTPRHTFVEIRRKPAPVVRMDYTHVEDEDDVVVVDGECRTKTSNGSNTKDDNDDNADIIFMSSPPRNKGMSSNDSENKDVVMGNNNNDDNKKESHDISSSSSKGWGLSQYSKGWEALKDLRRLSSSLGGKLSGQYDMGRRGSVIKMLGGEDEYGVNDFSEVRPASRSSTTPSRRNGHPASQQISPDRRQSYSDEAELPNVRRMGLTSQLEHAMELLDDMTSRPGCKTSNNNKEKMVTSLSHDSPLAAYLAWTSEWKNEFKVTK